VSPSSISPKPKRKKNKKDFETAVNVQLVSGNARLMIS
jgi:hypothetical protein